MFFVGVYSIDHSTSADLPSESFGLDGIVTSKAIRTEVPVRAGEWGQQS